MPIIPNSISSTIRTTLARGDHDSEFYLEYRGKKILVSLYKAGALVKMIVSSDVGVTEVDLTAPNEYQVFVMMGILMQKGGHCG